MVRKSVARFLAALGMHCIKCSGWIFLHGYTNCIFCEAQKKNWSAIKQSFHFQQFCFAVSQLFRLTSTGMLGLLLSSPGLQWVTIMHLFQGMHLHSTSIVCNVVTKTNFPSVFQIIFKLVIYDYVVHIWKIPETFRKENGVGWELTVKRFIIYVFARGLEIQNQVFKSLLELLKKKEIIWHTN